LQRFGLTHFISNDRGLSADEKKAHTDAVPRAVFRPLSGAIIAYPYLYRLYQLCAAWIDPGGRRRFARRWRWDERTTTYRADRSPKAERSGRVAGNSFARPVGALYSHRG